MGRCLSDLMALFLSDWLRRSVQIRSSTNEGTRILGDNTEDGLSMAAKQAAFSAVPSGHLHIPQQCMEDDEDSPC